MNQTLKISPWQCKPVIGLNQGASYIDQGNNKLEWGVTRHYRALDTLYKKRIRCFRKVNLALISPGELCEEQLSRASDKYIRFATHWLIDGIINVQYFF